MPCETQSLHISRNRPCMASFLTTNTTYCSNTSPRGLRDCYKVGPSLRGLLKRFTANRAVRTNVHFEAVIEHFSRFDAIFTAYTPYDFNDTAISAICAPRSDSIQTSSREPIANQDSRVRDAGDGFATADGVSDPMYGIGNRNQASYEPSMSQERPETSGQYPTPGESRSNRPQIDTAVPLVNEDEYDRSMASEEESDEDAVQELPCVEDDAISQTSSWRTPGGSQEWVPRTSGSDYLNRSNENFEQLRPKVKLFPRPVTDARVARPVPEGTTRQKLPAGLRRAKPDAEHARLSRASKSPKSGKSPRSQKSRRDGRQFSITQEEKALGPDAVEELPGAMQTSSTQVSAPPLVVQTSPIPVSAPPPIVEQAPLQQTPGASIQAQLPPAPSLVDFALLPRRPPTVSSVITKPWLTRAPSYGESTFSVLSSEKQRLMRVMELRKKNVAASSGALEQSQDRSKQTNVEANNNPSMSFMHQLMSPSPSHDPTSDARRQLSNRDTHPVSVMPVTRDSQDLSHMARPEDGELQMRQSPRNTFLTQREKRRATIEPIKTGLHFDRRDDASVSDDSFMEELQNAKVQQAKPMSLSPRSPLFSSDRGEQHRTGSVTSVMIHSPSRTSLRQKRSEPLLNGRPQLESIPYESEQTHYEESGASMQALPEPTLYTAQLATIPDDEQYQGSGYDEGQSINQRLASRNIQERVDDDHHPAMAQPGNNPSSSRPKHTNALLKDAVHTFYNVTRLTKEEQPRDQVSVTRIERKTKPPLEEPIQDDRSPPRDFTQNPTSREERRLEQSHEGTGAGGLQSDDSPRKLLTNELPRTRPLPQPAPPKNKKQPKPTVVTSVPRPSSSTDGANEGKHRRNVSQAKSHRTDDSTDDKQTMASQLLKRMSAFPVATQHPPSQQQAEYLRDQNRASSWPQIAPPAVTIGTLEVQLPDTLVSPNNVLPSSQHVLIYVFRSYGSVAWWKSTRRDSCRSATQQKR